MTMAGGLPKMGIGDTGGQNIQMKSNKQLYNTHRFWCGCSNRTKVKHSSKMASKRNSGGYCSSTQAILSSKDNGSAQDKNGPSRNLSAYRQEDYKFRRWTNA